MSCHLCRGPGLQLGQLQKTDEEHSQLEDLHFGHRPSDPVEPRQGALEGAGSGHHVWALEARASVKIDQVGG